MAATAAASAVASAGGLGAVVAVCANSPLVATIVTGLIGKALGGALGVSDQSNIAKVNRYTDDEIAKDLLNLMAELANK